MNIGVNIIVPKPSLEEDKKFWKQKKEEMVTSLFGLHVGHYKVSVQNDTILNIHWYCN